MFVPLSEVLPVPHTDAVGRGPVRDEGSEVEADSGAVHTLLGSWGRRCYSHREGYEVAMAKHRRSRRRRNANFVAIPRQFSVTVGALAPSTAVLSTTNLVPVKDLKVISVDGLWAWAEIQAEIDDTIEVGFSDADLTLAEVEEYLELTFLDPTDRIAKERAGRHVRRVGIISGLKGQTAPAGAVLNNGEVVRSRLNWKVGTKGLNTWVFNRSGAIYTTGSFVRCEATVYGIWTSQ